MQATSAVVLLHNGTAEAPTTNFSFSSLDLFPVKLSFCVGLPSALSLTLLFAVAIYKKVDVAHPVFAVILQASLFRFESRFSLNCILFFFKAGDCVPVCHRVRVLIVPTLPHGRSLSV